MAEAAAERAQQEATERTRRAAFDATATVLDDRSVTRGEALMAAGEALVGFRSALLRLESTGVHIAAAIAVINNMADNIGIKN
ncbi:hypothetical protein [Stenotrophomonas sp. NPDC077659]|uniref:hypothetical protein n=1 Tax=Stenotrophomonas sp. NPDC077659 TaxID=3390694 RepID=UPI003D07EDC1